MSISRVQPIGINQDVADLRFLRMGTSSKLLNVVKETLGGETFEKIARSRAAQFDVLHDNMMPVAVLSYDKPRENGGILYVNAFSIIGPKQKSGHSYEEALLQKIVHLAEDYLSKTIQFEISGQPPPVDWLSQKGLHITKKTNDIWSGQISTEQLLNKNKIEPPSLGSKESQGSRKRALEGDNMDDRKKQKPIPFKTHSLPMKGTIYFDYIMSGKKKFEGRVNLQTCVSMNVGDHLKMNDRQAGWGIECVVSSKDVYDSFEKMLSAKGVLNMLPQLEIESARCSSEELIKKGVKVYEAFPGAHKVRQFGCVAIGVNFLKKI